LDWTDFWEIPATDYYKVSPMKNAHYCVVHDIIVL